MLEGLCYIAVTRRPRGGTKGHTNLYWLLPPEAREQRGTVLAEEEEEEEPDDGDGIGDLGASETHFLSRSSASSAEIDTIRSAGSGTSPSVGNSTQNPVIVNPDNKNPDNEPRTVVATQLHPQPADAVVGGVAMGTKAKEESTKTTEKTTHEKAKRRTRLRREHFTVDATMRTWAIELGIPPSRIQPETETFFDHHDAKGSLMLDWVAAWRTWMHNKINWGTYKSIARSSRSI